MKGKYYGPLSLDDFYQALFQDKTDFFAAHGINRLRNATLYFTPCDKHDQPVQIKDACGAPIDGYVSAGAYKSAADAFDRPQEIEPRTISRDSGNKPVRKNAPTVR